MHRGASLLRFRSVEVAFAGAVHLVHHLHQVLAVLVLEHGLGYLHHALARDPAVAVGYALETSYLQALALLKHLDIDRRLGQRVVRAGVEPCEAAGQGLHLQLAVLEELLVDGRDLKLAACRRLDVRGHIHHLVGIEIEAHHGIVALGMLGLLLDGEAVALVVELGHAVALGIVDPVAEHRGLAILSAASTDLRNTCEKPAPWKILSPKTRQAESSPMNSLPMMNACARPSGEGCSA